MRLTYDAEANAAYLYVVEAIAPGQASAQQHSVLTPDGRGELVFDDDQDGHLLGMEVLQAEAVLSAEVLRRAEPPPA